MKKLTFAVAVMTAVVSLPYVSNAMYLQSMGSFSREVKLGDQKSLKVKLVLEGGKVWLTKAAFEVFFSVGVKYNREEMRPVYEYNEDEKESSLYFRIVSKDDEDDDYADFDIDIEFENTDYILGMSSRKKTSWDLKFTDKVPISLDITAGATKSNLDLSGMMISNLDIETGASRTFVNFDEPNPIRMDEFNLTLGIAKFKGSHLLNANFDEMNVESGIGKFTLDLTGELDHRAYVNIELGLSSTTIILPLNVGVKIYTDLSPFTSFDADDLIEVDDDEYESENWGDTEGELIIDIEAAIGFVDLVFEDR